jgi:hypothetical protein
LSHAWERHLAEKRSGTLWETTSPELETPPNAIPTHFDPAAASLTTAAVLQ